MYKQNDYIIYKREVCKVKEILKNYLFDKDYYLLSPLSDDSLTIKIPTDSKEIRPLISKEEILKLIEKMPLVEVVEADTKSLESIYKNLLLSRTHEDLIKIIKTTYLRNKERIEKSKKTTDKDVYYFNLAEKYLYQEFQVILGLTYDETKEFVIKSVSNSLSKWSFCIVDMLQCHI